MRSSTDLQFWGGGSRGGWSVPRVPRHETILSAAATWSVSDSAGGILEAVSRSPRGLSDLIPVLIHDHHVAIDLTELHRDDEFGLGKTDTQGRGRELDTS
jgi:hypothetical protein